MGISTDFKQWLRKRYPEAWILMPSNNEKLIREKGYPRIAPIVIIDGTYGIKYLKEPKKWSKEENKLVVDPIKSGHRYFLSQFMVDISKSYSLGAKWVYLCLDTNSPPNKAEEHNIRYKSREKMKTPNDPNEIMIDDETMPSDWSKASVNPEFTRELIYYLTQKLVSPKPLSKLAGNYIFTPPKDCKLFIHGGRLEKPKRHRPDLDQSPPPRLHLISNTLVNLPLSPDGIQRTEYRREHILAFPERNNDRKMLLEGEIACMYYLRDHPTQDVTIITSDGDLLILLLMASIDRIDPNTGEFKNKVYVQLKIGATWQYVDINYLWGSIDNDAEFQKKGISDAVLHISALSCLVKNDYIHNYTPGVGVKDKNSDTVCPWIIHTFINNIGKYKNMIKAQFLLNNNDGSSERGNLNKNLEITIDEELFIDFTKQCYVEKYKSAYIGYAKRKYGAEMKKKSLSLNDIESYLFRTYKIDMNNPSQENIKEYLSFRYKNGKYKSDKTRSNAKKNRMMTKGRIRVTSRQLLWVMRYWSNSYRENCSFPDPNALYRNLPYYGWEPAGIKICKTTKRVSIHCSDYNGNYKPWTPHPQLQQQQQQQQQHTHLEIKEKCNDDVIVSNRDINVINMNSSKKVKNIITRTNRKRKRDKAISTKIVGQNAQNVRPPKKKQRKYGKINVNHGNKCY